MSTLLETRVSHPITKAMMSARSSIFSLASRLLQMRHRLETARTAVTDLVGLETALNYSLRQFEHRWRLAVAWREPPSADVARSHLIALVVSPAYRQKTRCLNRCRTIYMFRSNEFQL
ncbi:unnamed protein product [Protopolystoma xenopodis]|uniref:Uncharacterized protein n=1 Tax=Protopolystoma xenopodis TaxID=117903 RepID=A0A448XA97_9PLAT|nr:unnamed protein product [Protopolystoma xenopodis]